MVSDITDRHQSGPGYRVMIFRLSSSKQWDVFGVGYLQRLAPGRTPAFIVNCEETDKRLMNHRISKDVAYAKQNDSIIVFYDTELNMDLAISFQDSDACQSVWDQVQVIIASSSSNNHVSLGSNCVLLDDNDINILRDSDHDPIAVHADLSLSSPTIDNLEKVLDEIQNVHADQKDELASLLSSTSFLTTLFDSFEQAKDLDAYDSLFTVFAIVKSLFFLNSVTVIEMMTGIDAIRNIIDILEYDPSLALLFHKDPSDISYNRYQKALEDSQFRNVVPITNEAIVQSIQRNYYILFIRDVILLRYLNDSLTQTLNNMLFSNIVNILAPLSTDIDFQERLFEKLSQIPLDMSSVTSDHIDILKFINELVTLAKSLPLRAEFYARLCHRGLLTSLANILYAWQDNIPNQQDPAHGCAHVICEILHTIVALDPQLIRAAMLSEGSSSKLALSLVGVITNKNVDIDIGIQYQASELLIALLHTESIAFFNQRPFVESCLESHLNQLCQCVKDPGSSYKSVITSASVLITLIREHGSTLEFTFKHIHWTDAALRLLHDISNMQLVLLGIRMVRAAFVQLFSSQSNSEPSSDAQNLLRVCVDVFLHNGPNRYNLLHSAVLDLLEYIRAQNIKNLLRYLADFELPRLTSVSNLPIFQDIRVRDEQNREGDDTVQSNTVMSDSKQSHVYCEMQREEQYFDSNEPSTDADIVMTDDLPQAAFIDRKKMQPKEEQIDFVSTVQKRKKLKVGSRPVMSIKKLVNYPIDDEEKGSEVQTSERRNPVTESYENQAADVASGRSDIQSVQCEPVSQQS